ncbi:MAG: metallophosphoesterase [Candidatus Nanoarchaeia archaeon]|jgi:predicted phosphodiesterase
MPQSDFLREEIRKLSQVNDFHVQEPINKKNIRAIVTGDYHTPFVDYEALTKMLSFTAQYKPDIFFINGDFMDMYTISDFEKNPDRVNSLSKDLVLGKKILTKIRDIVGPKCKIIYLEGNHSNRLQKFLWRNKEFKDLGILTVPKLLDLDSLNIEFVPCSRDYWRSQSGHYNLPNLIITHGDSRLNGAATSKYSGYSAKNTMYSLNSNVIIGHCHRLAQVYVTTPRGTMVGLESGCMCSITGTANWQQGFISFELTNNIFTPHLHFIK